MSKIIRLTQEHLQEIYKEFSEQIQSAKLTDGKISYTKSLGTIDRKATLIFTELAWVKMQTLVREFDKEVAWHGIAKRGDDPEKDEYIVSDIMVYPQEVTASTVNTDQEKYTEWLYKFDDDTFNNIRFQGHSHVNMSTSPSGVDITHQTEILSMLSNDMFYIFVIWNKKGDKTIKIYDMQKNVLFETSDVTVKIGIDNDMDEFLKEAKGMVKDKPIKSFSTSKTSSYFGGDYPYGGYYSSLYDEPYGSQYYQSNKKGSDNSKNNTNVGSLKKAKKGKRKK